MEVAAGRDTLKNMLSAAIITTKTMVIKAASQNVLHTGALL